MERRRAGLALAAWLAGAVPAGAADGSEPGSPGIRGFVIEAFSGRPLAGASVGAGGLSVRAAADGSYRLPLPAGSWTVETTAAGHLPDSRTVVLPEGAERRLDVYLLDRSRLQDSVTVEAGADPGLQAPALLPVRPAQVLQAAGGADNVFRTLQTLPGVAAAEEFGSRLAVRGGSPDQNLTVLDGVEIHNPYRLFGLASAFNPETVAGFELRAGAFDASHGDRLSSLLVVDTRDGDATRRFAGSSSLSITDANAILEGRLPSARSGSWLLTGRRTYYDLVAERFTDSDLPSFADLQAKASLETRPGQRLSLLALASREATDARFEGDRAGEAGDFLTAARNELLSLRLDTSLGRRAGGRTVAAFYRNTDGIDVDARFRNEERRSNAPADDAAFALASVVFTRTLAVRDWSLRQELFRAAGARQLLQAGVELHRLDTLVEWRIAGDRNPSEANGSGVRGGSGLPAALLSRRAAVRGGAWLQDRFHMMRRLVVEPGLRVDWSGVNRRAVVQPRLSGTLRLSERTRLRAAAGRYAQSPGYEKLFQSDYFVDLSAGVAARLEHERSWQAVLGFERDLAPGLALRAEAYAKGFSDLIVGSLESESEREARIARYDFPATLAASVPREPGITSQPVNGAAGRARGLELYLERRDDGRRRLSGWASYGYGVARREAYGRSLPFEYDRRHAVAVVAGWRAGRRLELAATARVASGFPFTPVRGLRVSAVADAEDGDGDGDRLELVPERDAGGRLVYSLDRGGVGQLLSSRLPAFARLDVRASYRPKGATGRWLLYLDVINLLDRENVGAYEARLRHDPGSDRPRLVLEPSQRLPRLPSLGVRFRF